MKDLVEFLTQHMSIADDRRALVQSALFGCSVLQQISWDGNAYTFTVSLVQTLLSYGDCEPDRPTIVMLLENLKQQVGVDKQMTIDRLIAAYSAPKQSASSIGGDTGKQSNALSFLSNVALWTADTLNEGWTLRRNAIEVRLDSISEEQLSVITPEILNDLIAVKGKAQVERVLERIRGNCNLIEGWKDAYVADQKEKQLGEMSAGVLQARGRDYNEKTTNTLHAIEADLHALGFTIEKSSQR